MSKKFVVEADSASITCECLRQMIVYRNANRLCDEYVTVTELPIVPEVKMVETGILMGPADITGIPAIVELGYGHIAIHKHLRVGNELIGKRLIIKEQSFPREFYRKDSIEKTWDFNSIPVGALLEVEDNDTVKTGVKAYGVYRHANDDCLHFGWQEAEKNHIKSIRIVEAAK